jgi:adenylate cyclase
LLDGLEGEERVARERLLERLVDDGFGVDELREAVAEDRLALLPVDRVLGGRYTAAEVQARSGLPAEMVLRVRRLLGLPDAGPDERVFGEEDVAAARSALLFLESGVDEQGIAEMGRILGEAMSRVAGTTTAVFLDAFLKPGDSEQDVAMRFATLARELAPAVGPVLISAYNAHLRDSVRRGMLGRADRAGGPQAGTQEMAVCFADLVGFTRLGTSIDPRELGTVAGKLAELATEVVAPPARVVKTIGDAAMLTSRDTATMVEVALSLVEAVEHADLPALRAGIAQGPVLARGGDLYGHAVNLASRVTGVARPGSVLCTQEVQDAAPEQFDWSFAGRHRLRGIAEAVPLYRARRLGDAPRPKPPRADRRRRRASS